VVPIYLLYLLYRPFPLQLVRQLLFLFHDFWLGIVLPPARALQVTDPTAHILSYFHPLFSPELIEPLANTVILTIIRDVKIKDINLVKIAMEYEMN
jgi:hypothetical protein